MRCQGGGVVERTAFEEVERWGIFSEGSWRKRPKPHTSYDLPARPGTRRLPVYLPEKRVCGYKRPTELVRITLQQSPIFEYRRANSYP